MTVLFVFHDEQNLRLMMEFSHSFLMSCFQGFVECTQREGALHSTTRDAYEISMTNSTSYMSAKGRNREGRNKGRRRRRKRERDQLTLTSPRKPIKKSHQNGVPHSPSSLLMSSVRAVLGMCKEGIPGDLKSSLERMCQVGKVRRMPKPVRIQ